MEPRIQYAETADGVNIAFWTLGEGLPVVETPNVPWNHIQLEWQWPGYRRWFERLTEKRKLIRYDSRGCGLSDREVADCSLDAYMLDLEAVVQRLGLDRFVLLASGNAGPVAITYAARHPERVSRLVLWCAIDFRQSRLRAFRALREGDWELFMETLAHAAAGWSAGEEASRVAAFLRGCATREAAGAALTALREADITPFLSQVSAPTLLMVGGDDLEVLQLNREALELLGCDKHLEVVPGATHLFEEPGTLEHVAGAAARWFARHLGSRSLEATA